ncbi:unnamed protein product, partial [Brenthis ino]
MYAMIMNAKVNGEKYYVKEMAQNEFMDIKELIKNKNWVKDEEGKKISWSKVMEVSVLHSQPTILHFKYEFDADSARVNVEPHQTVTARNKRDTRLTANKTSASFSEPQLKLAYNKSLPVSKALHTDLMSLCRAEAIPTYYHGFYNSLTFINSPDDHLHDNYDEDEED